MGVLKRQTPSKGATGNWSLANRLAWFYTLAASLILILASHFWYSWLVQSLERDDIEFLADRVTIVGEILRLPDGHTILEQQVAFEGSYSPINEPHYTRVLDDGRTVLESPGMRLALPSAIFPVVDVIDVDAPKVKRWRSHAGRDYILMAAHAQFAKTASRPPLIQTAVDVSQEEAVIAGYRVRLLTLLVISIVAAAVAGRIVTQRGMRPVRNITDVATMISAAQLNRRIGLAGRPAELVDLAIAFDRMLERLEQSFSRLSNFSADIAHELRTPINNLIGEAEVALERVRTAEDYRNVIESSLEEYARLSHMIGNLLFLARAENEDEPITRRRLVAAQEIAKVMEFYHLVARDAGIGVTCEGDGYVDADPMLFRRALSNLISNALRHTPRNGAVSVRILGSSDDCVEISVCDTGSGIATEHLPRVFDRFYRADRVRSGASANLGLGLALVKAIMELHRGTAEITSVQGQGTVVVLRFPTIKVAEAGAADPALVKVPPA